MTEPRRPRCSALTRGGDQCSKPAAPGRDVCKVHGGATTGRPLKLTADRITKIAKALRDGAYREQAATLAGIGRSTFYAWLERAEADRETDTPSPFRDLLDAVTRAEADAEAKAVGYVRVQAKQDWRAAAWFLERKYPHRWGRRLEVKHEGEVDIGKPRVVTPDTDERRLAVASLLRDSGALERAEDPADE